MEEEEFGNEEEIYTKMINNKKQTNQEEEWHVGEQKYLRKRASQGQKKKSQKKAHLSAGSPKSSRSAKTVNQN
ncbi:hypothetical protein E2C01_002113 [Portunus trituberculatus]|uniref:Uncharacterized protein n=1 Tax=Portunus trituberculatus TaxID=210409 RepID=A0A5B7CJI5_PORTR|nr:hypothetical protein [Portunus trituberculatus]